MTTNPDHSDEVPEADALEQDRALVDDEPVDPEPDSMEAPDADAYEQRQSLEAEDEDHR